mgnify:CR=1 FL=1
MYRSIWVTDDFEDDVIRTKVNLNQGGEGYGIEPVTVEEVKTTILTKYCINLIEKRYTIKCIDYYTESKEKADQYYKNHNKEYMVVDTEEENGDIVPFYVLDSKYVISQPWYKDKIMEESDVQRIYYYLTSSVFDYSGMIVSSTILDAALHIVLCYANEDAEMEPHEASI